MQNTHIATHACRLNALMAGVDDIISDWIKDAEKSGELTHGRYFGKPFDLDDGYFGTPPHLRMAHKVLKNAGHVPAEVELQTVLADLKQRLESAEDDAEARELRLQIAECRVKIAMLIERNRRRG